MSSPVREEKPGLWYAISTTGDIAEAVNGTLRIIGDDGALRWEQTPEGWPTAQPMAGGPPLKGAMWGHPMFTPSGLRLATLHQGGITLWDARTGKVVRTVVSDRLSLVRGIELSTDGKLGVLRCNSNYEGPANHTAFVVDLEADAGSAGPVELPWQKGAVVDASFTGRDEVATLDEYGVVRLYSTNGDFKAELSFPGHVTTFSSWGAFDRVVAVGEKGGVWLWEKASQTVRSLRNDGGPVYFIRTTADAQAWVVEVAGRAQLVSGQSAPTALPLVRHDGDPALMKARSALWLLARNDFEQAVHRLERFASNRQDLRFTVAFQYASLRRHDRNADFAVHLSRNGMPPADRGVAPAVLSLAEDFGNASAISLSLDFFMTWFHARQTHSELAGDDERAISIGRGLASDLRSNDDNGAAGKLLAIMLKQWPGRWDLTEAIADTLTYEDKKAALDTVSRYLAVHKSELRAWKALAEIRYAHDDDPNGEPEIEKLLAEAGRHLDPSQHETHGFLGFGYLRLGKNDLAARHYQSALRLAPNEQEYKSRLKQLGAKAE